MNNDSAKKAVGDEIWDEKSETLNGTTYRYSATWIKKLEAEEHWRLYWKQQALLNNFISEGDSVLEIGVGSGFTANYLRSKGHEVTTFDIDSDKSPDIVGNLVEHEFDRSYDHILAFEVFEHIPYDEFLKALKRIRKNCNKSLCLSVPIARREIASVEFKVPKLNKRRLAFSIPVKKLWDYHFWEIGFEGTTKSSFLNDLSAINFEPRIADEKSLRLFVGCEAAPVSGAHEE